MKDIGKQTTSHRSHSLPTGNPEQMSLDDRVEYWHTHPTEEGLRCFLGLTEEEYAKWGRGQLTDEAAEEISTRRIKAKQYPNIIFSETGNVHDCCVAHMDFENGDIRSIVVVVNEDGLTSFTENELKDLDNFGKILSADMKQIRGELHGSNYFMIEKTADGYAIRRRTWERTNFYDGFAKLLQRYVDRIREEKDVI